MVLVCEAPLQDIAEELDFSECPGGGTENCEQPFSQPGLSFHEALYFVIVTFSTVNLLRALLYLSTHCI